MPEELKAERDAALRNARQWLFENRPVSTEDAAFRLMGLVWAQGAREEIAAAQRDLASRQASSGGWPQLRGYAADAYSTGEALFALHESGLPASDTAFNKGLKFLTANQATDGTWRGRTRMLSPAEVSPKYFTTGFPYGKDEYLSYAGSCWAVMALLSALPESPRTAQPAPLISRETPSWLSTALFGSEAQLAALLDAGLDPNSKTSEGTTVLMAASADADKVRLLLARGADAKMRASSGVDALTVAAAYRRTAASIQALLDAGADAEPPEGSRLRNHPVVLASMSGDLDIVKLLLSRGAKPSEKALGQAVTFGYPEIVRTLIASGADSKIVESSGINLLHWAAVTNRAEVIPALVEAHVPINSLDDNGFTPLMYAATLDFGDTEVLKALLKAGADKTIRNFESRTPAAQARRYKHAHLEAALR